MAQGATTNPPKFYTIESVSRPGYFVTQQGTQIVLNSRNPLNPFQLWYRDDSWSFLGQAYVFINHGSKKALKSQLSNTTPATYKATVGDYDPAVEDDSIMWSYVTENDTVISLHSSPVVHQVHLSHGTWSSSLPDGVPVTSSTVSSTMLWRVALYEPTTIYKIQSPWATQFLTWKQKLVDFTPKDSVTHNDEHTVVAVSSNNQLDGMAWYKVPAGGRDNTTFGSSFIVINRSTGFALKGSTKPGDKVILTQYDPLDYNFVWSENRVPGTASNSIVINLDGTTLQWHLELDSEYQNSAYYHPLTLFPAEARDVYLDRQNWIFIKS